jgi:hypothetical protein
VMLFWFLLGIFSRIREATFSGGTGKTRLTGLETKATSKCKVKKRLKNET